MPRLSCHHDSAARRDARFSVRWGAAVPRALPLDRGGRGRRPFTNPGQAAVRHHQGGPVPNQRAESVDLTRAIDSRIRHRRPQLGSRSTRCMPRSASDGRKTPADRRASEGAGTPEDTRRMPSPVASTIYDSFMPTRMPATASSLRAKGVSTSGTPARRGQSGRSIGAVTANLHRHSRAYQRHIYMRPNRPRPHP
jgi:hypothetical protein